MASTTVMKSVTVMRAGSSTKQSPSAKPKFSLPFGKKAVTPAKADPKRAVRKAVRSTAPAEQKSTKFAVTVPRRLLASEGSGRAEIPVELGFTKSNELFVGRMAMLGFGSALVGELVSGKGPLAQFDVETGVNLFDTEWFLIALIGFNLFAALAPAKGKFVPEKKEKQTPEGVLREFVPSSGFGFTKENELFVGRVAQLGFASALIGELITGKGALAQLGAETGVSLAAAEPWVLIFISTIFLAAASNGSGSFATEDEE